VVRYRVQGSSTRLTSAAQPRAAAPLLHFALLYRRANRQSEPQGSGRATFVGSYSRKSPSRASPPRMGSATKLTLSCSWHAADCFRGILALYLAPLRRFQSAPDHAGEVIHARERASRLRASTWQALVGLAMAVTSGDLGPSQSDDLVPAKLPDTSTQQSSASRISLRRSARTAGAQAWPLRRPALRLQRPAPRASAARRPRARPAPVRRRL